MQQHLEAEARLRQARVAFGEAAGRDDAGDSLTLFSDSVYQEPFFLDANVREDPANYLAVPAAIAHELSFITELLRIADKRRRCGPPIGSALEKALCELVVNARNSCAALVVTKELALPNWDQFMPMSMKLAIAAT